MSKPLKKQFLHKKQLADKRKEMGNHFSEQYIKKYPLRAPVPKFESATDKFKKQIADKIERNLPKSKLYLDFSKKNNLKKLKPKIFNSLLETQKRLLKDKKELREFFNIDKKHINMSFAGILKIPDKQEIGGKRGLRSSSGFALRQRRPSQKPGYLAELRRKRRIRGRSQGGEIGKMRLRKGLDQTVYEQMARSFENKAENYYVKSKVEGNIDGILEGDMKLVDALVCKMKILEGYGVQAGIEVEAEEPLEKTQRKAKKKKKRGKKAGLSEKTNKKESKDEAKGAQGVAGVVDGKSSGSTVSDDGDEDESAEVEKKEDDEF